MTDTSTGTRPLAPSVPTRPVRKDEIELSERGIYVESWLPERRSRRRPLLFVHGELAGSWVWERHLQYFAARGWEGHALNLRNHFWSQTADPTTLSFDTYTEDVLEAIERLGESVVVVGHGMGGLLALKAVERRPVGGLVLLSSELPRELRDAGPCPRAARGPRRLRARRPRLGDPARTAPARPSRPGPGRHPAHPAPARPEAARVGRGSTPDDRGRPDRAGPPRRDSHPGRRRRASTGTSRSRPVSAWPSGCRPTTSRSARTPTTGWSWARPATSRSPRRSGRSSRRTGCRVRAGIIPAGPALDATGRPAAFV